MRILTCIKKILADESDVFIENNRIEKECLIYKLNLPDVRAFYEGTRIKEKHAGSILDVVTVDGGGSEPFLRFMTAFGGDNGYRLWDDALEEGTELNNREIAEILSNFIKKQEYHLILFGNRSEYFGAGSLPVILGCELGIPVITNITQIEQSDDDGMLVHKMLEKGRRVVYRCRPKLILSFDGVDQVSLGDDVEKLIESHEVAINVIPFSELGMEGSLIGRNAERVEYSYPKPRTKYVLIPESESVEDRLGFLMGGGLGKKDSGVIEGKPDRVAEEICNSLAQRNVFKRI